MFKGRFLKVIIFLFSLSICLRTIPSWAKISVTIIGFKNHPRSIQEQKESLRIIYPPETEIRYFDWKSSLAQNLLSEIKAKAVPQVIYEKGIEEKDVFLPLVKNGVIEKKEERYVLPEGPTLDILGRVKYFYKRDRLPNRLDLFVMSACPFGVAAEKRLINYIRREELRDIDLKIHCLVQFDEKGNPNSVRGEKELEEDIRQMFIQKFHPEIFWDYLLSINKDNYLKYEERLKNFNISEKDIFDFKKEATAWLRKDMKLSQELGAFASPTILWENQYLIDTHIPFLSNFKPFNKKERWLKKSAEITQEEKVQGLKLEYFYTLNCPPCFEIKNKILSDLKKAYSNKLKILEYDAINNEEGRVRLKTLEEDFGLLTEAGVPSIYFMGNFLMGGVEIEERLEALIKKQLGEPNQTIEVRLGRTIIKALFLRINTVFSRFSWVLLLVFLIHLRQLNCPSNKFIFLLIVFLFTAFISSQYIKFSSPVILRYVLFIILFAFLFYLGILKLYEYYQGEAVQSKLFQIIQKEREDIFLFSEGLFLGYLASFLSEIPRFPQSGFELMTEFFILLLFFLFLFLLFQRRFLINFFKRHQNSARLLNAGLLFMLSVFVWLLK